MRSIMKPMRLKARTVARKYLSPPPGARPNGVNRPTRFLLAPGIAKMSVVVVVVAAGVVAAGAAAAAPR